MLDAIRDEGEIMIFAVWLLGVAVVVLAFVVSYVWAFMQAFRRGYSGPRIVGTWTLIKMALRTLVGRKS